MKYSLKISVFFAIFAVISFTTVNIFPQKTKIQTSIKTSKSAVVSQIPKVTQIDEIKIKQLLKPNGKPLLVNFWATWCIPCREEFPELVEIDKEYKGRIDFITISLDDPAETNRDVPKFLNEMKATMPAYLLRTTDENAVISSISKDWAGGLPFSVLYNKDGEIVHFKQGKIKIDVVKEKINELLESDKDAIVSAEQITELPKFDSFFPSEKYNYKKGIENAKKDISNGKFVIMRYGFGPGIAENSRNKLKEKYKIEYKEYGCIVTPNLVEYIKGYNEISQAEIKRRFGKDF